MTEIKNPRLTFIINRDSTEIDLYDSDANTLWH